MKLIEVKNETHYKEKQIVSSVKKPILLLPNRSIDVKLVMKMLKT